MGGLAEIAATMLALNERRLEAISHNVANTGTAGFKAQSPFQTPVDRYDPAVSGVFLPKASSVDAEGEPLHLLSRMAQGVLQSTDRQWDLAISGQGLFALRETESEGMIYSRHGAFDLDGQGYVVDPGGRRLQSAEGLDIRLDSGNTEILSDGTLLVDGIPSDRIGLFVTGNADALLSVGGTDFRLKEGAQLDRFEGGTIRQGMLEASNVELANEVVSMMEAVRQAETGARLMQTYDTLLGQAISALGPGGR